MEWRGRVGRVGGVAAVGRGALGERMSGHGGGQTSWPAASRPATAECWPRRAAGGWATTAAWRRQGPCANRCARSRASDVPVPRGRIAAFALPPPPPPPSSWRCPFPSPIHSPTAARARPFPHPLARQRRTRPSEGGGRRPTRAPFPVGRRAHRDCAYAKGGPSQIVQHRGCSSLLALAPSVSTLKGTATPARRGNYAPIPSRPPPPHGSRACPGCAQEQPTAAASARPLLPAHPRPASHVVALLDPPPRRPASSGSATPHTGTNGDSVQPYTSRYRKLRTQTYQCSAAAPITHTCMSWWLAPRRS